MLTISIFMSHDAFLFFIVFVVVKHFVGAVEVRNDEVDNFFIFTTPTVDDPRVEISFVLDRALHGSQGKLLLFIVAITTDLDSHRADQAGIKYLKIIVFVVEQFTLLYKL